MFATLRKKILSNNENIYYIVYRNLIMNILKKFIVIFRKSITKSEVKCWFSYLPIISKGGV